MSIDNMQKYANYKVQMGRLNKALANHFYLEAIFIEYAVLEDRLESILRNSCKWNSKPGSFVSIYQKCKRVSKLSEEKKGLAHKYFSQDLIDRILDWKDRRNPLIHALLKRKVTTEDLQSFAEEGKALARELSNKVTSYNRKIDKLKGKN